MEHEQTMRIIGLRQVMRALEAGELMEARIARDADDPLREQLVSALEAANVPYQFVESKLELGKLCGINVGAAVAGTTKLV